MARKRYLLDEGDELPIAQSELGGPCGIGEACADADNNPATNDNDDGGAPTTGPSPVAPSVTDHQRAFVEMSMDVWSDVTDPLTDYLDEVINHGWRDALSTALRTSGQVTGVMSYGLD